MKYLKRIWFFMFAKREYTVVAYGISTTYFTIHDRAGVFKLLKEKYNPKQDRYFKFRRYE